MANYHDHSIDSDACARAHVLLCECARDNASYLSIAHIQSVSVRRVIHVSANNGCLAKGLFAMNKMTKVIVLGALTAGFAFVGCSAAEDIDNSATAGHPGTAGTLGIAGTAPISNGGTTGSAGSSSIGGTTSRGGTSSNIAGGTSIAGTSNTTGPTGPVTGTAGTGSTTVPVTSTAGSSSTTGTTPASNSGGCSVRHGVTSDSALAGIALALALAFAAQRRRRQ
jgi:MYXO-CTERM domain-containing protein